VSWKNLQTEVNRSKVKVIRSLSRPTFFIYDDVQDGAEQVCGAAVTWPGAEQVGGAGVPAWICTLSSALLVNELII